MIGSYLIDFDKHLLKSYQNPKIT